MARENQCPNNHRVRPMASVQPDMMNHEELARARHELRTPINHILGYCEILLEQEDMPEETIQDLKKIHRGGKQLLELIARHLDPSNFQTLKDWQHLQPELRTPVNQIIGYCELLIEDATESGQRALTSDLNRIRTGAKQFLELMESLLSKASPSVIGSLPGAKSPASAVHASIPTATTRSRSQKSTARTGSLLVVDDDQASRELLARRLHRMGFHVATAASGQETLELLARQSFELLLVDWSMPQMDGMELLRRIRDEPRISDLPVIMVTGHDSSEDVAQALELGANDYLTKPVEFQAALARVRAQLELSRTNSELKRRIAESQQLADHLRLRNEFIKRAFGRYVSDDVVESLLENPNGLQMGGQKRNVTLLMSDLRGFTALVERLEPEVVVKLLNTYLDAMAQVILKFGGTIDEFIGDAILAVFGAPLSAENHAEAAVACGLAMQLEMESVNRKLGRLKLPALEMGIGINSGEVVVGNIGSEKRTKYGVVGAQVNVVGRIQSTSVGGEILVSEATSTAIPGRIKSHRSLTIWPKGASIPLKLYSVFGLRGQDHLDLPSMELTPTTEAKRIPVRVSMLLESKILSNDTFAAQLAVVSAWTGFLDTDRTLFARSDLNLTLTPKPGTEPENVYCKVMDAEVGPSGWEVRFTSTLPRSLSLV